MRLSNEELKRKLREMLSQPEEDRALQVRLLEVTITSGLVTPLLCHGDWKTWIRRQQTPPERAEEAIRLRTQELENLPAKLAAQLQELRTLTGDDDAAWAARLQELRNLFARTNTNEVRALEVADQYLPRA